MPYSRKLVDLIEKNADRLSKRCVELVRSHPNTPTYSGYDSERLYRRAFRVYSQLGRWISRETSREEVGRVYIALGAQRHEEGFALSEVIQALLITRHVLWDEVLEEGLLDNALDLHLAVELYTLVSRFVDRAVVFTSIGYERGVIEDRAELETIVDAVS